MGYNINIDNQYWVYSIDTRKVDIYNIAYIIFNKATYRFLSTSLSLNF